MRSSLLPLLLAMLALGTACRTPTRELPVGWDEEHPQEFATRALALEPGPWSAAAAARLGEAALGRDETSVRAVVLLAHDGDAQSVQMESLVLPALNCGRRCVRTSQ